MRKHKQLLLSVILLLLVSLFAVQCTAEYVRPKDEIIRELAYTYYWNPTSSDSRVNALLGELKKANADAARSWTRILSYWKYCDQEMIINYTTPSDDLKDDDTLCIVILGFELNYDGTMKEELLGRLETALESAKKYPNAYILCTGGGTASANPDVSEAGEMAQWLEENGISKNRILIENRSLTTTQNAMYSCKLMEEKAPQVSSVVIVSSDYHIPWGALLFETSFILSGRDLSVVGNAAYEAPNPPEYSIRKFQLNGILEIAKISGWE